MVNKYLIKYGTAQGSCLGPLLFNIFCNDIYYNVDYCNLILFADDTTLYASHRNSTYLNYILQHDFDNLEKWFRANKLSLNLNKTSTTTFWPNYIDNPIRIITSERTLPNEECTKFLGVTINNKLTWIQHIENIITKLNTNKILIGKSKHLMNQPEKDKFTLHIYIESLGLCQHSMEQLHNRKTKKTIEKIQKYCVRAI